MNKKVLAVAISSALAAPMVAQAVEFKVSGHINRMIRFADNGLGSDVQFVDNTASRSRVRFTGSSDIGGGMKAGVNLELGFASNRSGAVDIKGADTADSYDGLGGLRHSALYFSGGFGMLTMGHTSEAADGMAAADLSGTFLGDEYAIDHCSGCTTNTGAASTASYGTFDGGRLDVLRYDSPALGPVTIAASAGNNDRYSVAAFVNADVGGGSLAINAGYLDGSGGSSATDTWAVSGSFLFSQGTSISATWSEAEQGAGAPDAQTWGAKLGHKWGNNAVSVSYVNTEDKGAAGNDTTKWGVGWVHKMAKPGVEIYAGYHNMDFDRAGVDDLDFFVVGSRVQFK